ncbi:MAG: hypothetical protein JWO61_384 [Candidatus Saccharibacteria bacterium]|nr:hypothetical protein [Candidatus Saccharibacteria bacterium]
MHSLLLTIHIIALSLSIIATVTMAIMALLSHATPFVARRTNLFITGIGIALGGILLIQHPLGARCLELTAYLIVFSLAYRFVSVRSTQLSPVKAEISNSR